MIYTLLSTYSEFVFASTANQYTSNQNSPLSKDKDRFPNNMYVSPEYPQEYYPKHIKTLSESLSHQEEYYKIFVKYITGALVPGYKKALSAAYNHEGSIHTINYIKYDKDYPKPTNLPLDFYISGKLTFFTVKTKDGKELYTQDGRFTLQQDGLLVTTVGQHQVLGKNGPIFLESSEVTVKTNGDIFYEGGYVDTFKIIAFKTDRGIWTDNFTHFYKLYPNLVEEEEPFVQITQGYLEGGNSRPGMKTASDFLEFHTGITKASKVFFQSYAPMYRAVSPDN